MPDPNDITPADNRPRNILGLNTFAFRPGQSTRNRIDLDNVYGVVADNPPDFSPIKDRVMVVTDQFFNDIDPMLADAQKKIQSVITNAVDHANAELEREKAALPESSSQWDRSKIERKQNDLNKVKTEIQHLGAPAFIGSEYDVLSNAINIAQGDKTNPFYENALDQRVNDNSDFFSADYKVLTSLGITKLSHLAGRSYSLLNDEDQSKVIADISEVLAPIKQRLKQYGDAAHEAAGGHKLPEYMPVGENKEILLDDFSKRLDYHVESLQRQREEAVTLSGNIESYVPAQQVRDIEFRHNALYLRALSELMKEHGYNVTPEELFHGAGRTGALFGSQLLIHTRDFDGPNSNLLDGAFKNESTTPYQFDFNFTIKSLEAKTASGAVDSIGINVPTMAFDAKAVHDLKNLGVSRDMLEKHMINHLTISALSEHDGSAHQPILAHLGNQAFYQPIPNIEEIRKQLPASMSEEEIKATMETVVEQVAIYKKMIEPILEGKELPPVHTATYVEDHALSLHAKIMGRLFENSPKRKELVLKREAESYLHIGEIQKTALSNATTPDAKFTANELATYLAEIQTHRLGRVISLDDPDLHKKLDIRMPDGTVRQMSVADAADSLMNDKTGQKIITPERLLPLPTGGVLDTLEHHTSEAVGKGTYRAIHKIDSFPLMVTDGAGEIKEVKLLSAIDALAEIRRFEKSPAHEAGIMPTIAEPLTETQKTDTYYALLQEHYSQRATDANGSIDQGRVNNLIQLIRMGDGRAQGMLQGDPDIQTAVSPSGKTAVRWVEDQHKICFLGIISADGAIPREDIPWAADQRKHFMEEMSAGKAMQASVNENSKPFLDGIVARLARRNPPVNAHIEYGRGQDMFGFGEWQAAVVTPPVQNIIRQKNIEVAAPLTPESVPELSTPTDETPHTVQERFAARAKTLKLQPVELPFGSICIDGLAYGHGADRDPKPYSFFPLPSADVENRLSSIGNFEIGEGYLTWVDGEGKCYAARPIEANKTALRQAGYGERSGSLFWAKKLTGADLQRWQAIENTPQNAQEALAFAIKAGDLPGIDAAISDGARIGSHRGTMGAPAVFTAMEELWEHPNRVEVVRRLLPQSSLLHEHNTVLHKVMRGYQDYTSLIPDMIKQGADPFTLNDQGIPAFLNIQSTSDPKVVKANLDTIMSAMTGSRDLTIQERRTLTAQHAFLSTHLNRYIEEYEPRQENFRAKAIAEAAGDRDEVQRREAIATNYAQTQRTVDQVIDGLKTIWSPGRRHPSATVATEETSGRESKIPPQVVSITDGLLAPAGNTTINGDQVTELLDPIRSLSNSYVEGGLVIRALNSSHPADRILPILLDTTSPFEKNMSGSPAFLTVNPDKPTARAELALVVKRMKSEVKGTDPNKQTPEQQIIDAQHKAILAAWDKRDADKALATQLEETAQSVRSGNITLSQQDLLAFNQQYNTVPDRLKQPIPLINGLGKLWDEETKRMPDCSVPTTIPHLLEPLKSIKNPTAETTHLLDVLDVYNGSNADDMVREYTTRVVLTQALEEYSRQTGLPLTDENLHVFDGQTQSMIDQLMPKVRQRLVDGLTLTQKEGLSETWHTVAFPDNLLPIKAAGDWHPLTAFDAYVVNPDRGESSITFKTDVGEKNHKILIMPGADNVHAQPYDDGTVIHISKDGIETATITVKGAAPEEVGKRLAFVEQENQPLLTGIQSKPEIITLTHNEMTDLHTKAAGGVNTHKVPLRVIEVPAEAFPSGMFTKGERTGVRLIMETNHESLKYLSQENVMNHCVGKSGNYSSQCLAAKPGHAPAIISVDVDGHINRKNNRAPLSTIDALWDGTTLSVRQNYGYGDSWADERAKAAEVWFKRQLESGAIQISPQLGETERSKIANAKPEILRTMGFNVHDPEVENLGVTTADACFAVYRDPKRKARAWNPETHSFDQGVGHFRDENHVAPRTTEVELIRAVQVPEMDAGGNPVLNKKNLPKYNNIVPENAQQWSELHGMHAAINQVIAPHVVKVNALKDIQDHPSASPLLQPAQISANPAPGTSTPAAPPASSPPNGNPTGPHAHHHDVDRSQQDQTQQSQGQQPPAQPVQTDPKHTHHSAEAAPAGDTTSVVDGGHTESTNQPTNGSNIAIPVAGVMAAASSNDEPDTLAPRANSPVIVDEHNTSTQHTHGVGSTLGKVGLISRIQDIREHGGNGLDVAAIGLDATGMFTNNTEAGSLGQITGGISQTYKGYQEDGAHGAEREGTKTMLNTVVGNAIHASKETKDFGKAIHEAWEPTRHMIKAVPSAIKQVHTFVKTLAAGKGVLISGEAVVAGLNNAKNLLTWQNAAKAGSGATNFAGQAGLFNSFMKVSGDGIDYATGKKALTLENGTDTTVNTVMELDPVKAVTSMVGLKIHGHDVSIQTAVSYATGNHGQTLSEIGNETVNRSQQFDQYVDQASEAVLVRHHPKQPPMNGHNKHAEIPQKEDTVPAPDIRDYESLFSMQARSEASVRLAGKCIDGHNIIHDFNKIDWSKKENRRTYYNALIAAEQSYERVIANTAKPSLLPEQMWFGARAQANGEATANEAAVTAATSQWSQFEVDMERYQSHRLAQTVKHADVKAACDKLKSIVPNAKTEQCDHMHTTTPNHHTPHNHTHTNKPTIH